MEAIAARDPEALGALFDRHAGTVFGACLRVLRDRDEAEDVVEDVFWELWQRPARFDPRRGAPRAYLLVLARSRAQDRARARQRDGQKLDQLREHGEWNRLSHGDASGPLEQVTSARDRERVRHAFEQLKPEPRAVLERLFYGGLTQVEVAEHLELPLGTVKSRTRSGLAALRRILREDAP